MWAYIGVEFAPDLPEVVTQVRIHEFVVSLVGLLEGCQGDRDEQTHENQHNYYCEREKIGDS